MKTIKYGRVLSCALNGISGILIEIEVSLLPGLPHFEIVGLGDCAVRESRDRVRAAIRNSGYEFPQGRLTASYAPAWFRKEGTGFDLALALAILVASGQLKINDSKKPVCVIGELSLTGRVKHVPGVICRVGACVDKKIKSIMVPDDNFYEAAAISGSQPLPVSNIREAALLLASDDEHKNDLLAKKINEDLSNRKMPQNHEDAKETERAGEETESQNMLALVAGQEQAVRAMILAAAGWHHCLLLGSPGCGKTTLAKLLPAILPPMNSDEARTVTMIHSSAKRLAEKKGLIENRPFESPHHTTTRAAMTGGGRSPVPGLCSLSHRGVLFLDELTRFSADVLDCLRQPLESRKVNITRLDYNVHWPADFLLIGAANPCRCGNYFESDAICRCTEDSVNKHLGKIGGPLLDRMDITIEMRRLKAKDLPASVNGTINCRSALKARKEVARCWQLQYERCLEHEQVPLLNSRVENTAIADLFELDSTLLDYAAISAEKLTLSARGYIKALRLARTIADLNNDAKVTKDHINEALQYRLHN